MKPAKPLPLYSPANRSAPLVVPALAVPPVQFAAQVLEQARAAAAMFKRAMTKEQTP